jgi:FlaA1/EpsC-like NDP-sugar epimerase
LIYGDLALRPIGFVDDDTRLRQRTINQVPVLGPASDLASILDRQPVASLVISSEKIRPDRLEEVLAICNAHRIPVLQGHLKLEPLGTNGNGGKNGGEASSPMPATEGALSLQAVDHKHH